MIPLAFAIPRGDEDFRLLVDGALSRLFLSKEIGNVYGKWFGEISEGTLFLFTAGCVAGLSKLNRRSARMQKFRSS